MTTLTSEAIQNSSNAALSNYSRWVKTGFWASFFMIDEGRQLRHIKKLPSENVFEQMCSSLVDGCENVSPEEMEQRLSFMEALLLDMRNKESQLLDTLYERRRRGINALFLFSILVIMLIGFVGIQPGPLAVISSTAIIALSAIAFLSSRHWFQIKYISIRSDAGNPGNRQRFILWGH